MSKRLRMDELLPAQKPRDVRRFGDELRVVVVNDDESRPFALQFETEIHKSSLYVFEPRALQSERLLEGGAASRLFSERPISRPRLHITGFLRDRRSGDDHRVDSMTVAADAVRLLFEREHDIASTPLDLAHLRRTAIVPPSLRELDFPHRAISLM